MPKRVHITMSEFQEIIQAQRWCAERGFVGLRDFYGDLLGEHERRGTLPLDVMRQRAYDRQARDDRESR